MPSIWMKGCASELAAAAAFVHRVPGPTGRAPVCGRGPLLDDPAAVSDVAATAASPYAVLAVTAPFGGKQGAVGSDLVRLDTTSGDLSRLLTRSSGQESFGSPAGWFDASG